MLRSGSSRSSWQRILALPVGVLAAGCNAIIGIADVPYASDASTDGTMTAPDAATFEGAAPDSGIRDAAVSADESEAAEASPCGDTMSSGTNCGSCGHGCLGGQCSMGSCQPVALVPVDSGVSPYGLAQDDRFLYWTDYYGGAINRTDKVSGSTELLAQGAAFPVAITNDDAGVYWGDLFGVSSCNKSDCTQSTSVVARYMQSGVVSLAVDDSSVYWSEANPFVLRAGKSGTNQSAVPLWQGDASAEHVATDGQRIYFTADDGLLHIVGVDGGAPLAIGVPSTQGSSDVALDTSNVYWSISDPMNGFIDYSHLASPTPSTLASNQSNPGSIASDGTNVYWLANTSSSANASAVVGCAIASCRTPRVLATLSTPNLRSIVVDQSAIYFVQPGSSSNNGGVWKLAK
jgi:hypothetical protein